MSFGMELPWAPGFLPRTHSSCQGNNYIYLGYEIATCRTGFQQKIPISVVECLTSPLAAGLLFCGQSRTRAPVEKPNEFHQ